MFNALLCFSYMRRQVFFRVHILIQMMPKNSASCTVVNPKVMSYICLPNMSNVLEVYFDAENANEQAYKPLDPHWGRGTRI